MTPAASTHSPARPVAGRAAGPVRSRRRAWIAAFALVATLLAPAAVARAEVIDFNPARDSVPAILSPEDMARYEALSNTRFIYLISTPNPAGTKVFAFHGQGVGFVDLQSGAITGLAADTPAPGYAISPYRWLDDERLATINAEPVMQDGAEVTRHHRVVYHASTGRIESTEIALDAGGEIVGFSHDLETIAVMEFESENPPPARSVTLGPRYGGPEPDLPPGVDALDDLPGVANRHPLGTLEVQQVAFKIALKALDGSGRRELTAVPPETSLSGVTWSPDGRRVALGFSTMPGWDGDRARDNDPPPAGLPNLGSINVREALGRVPPAENPLVVGTHIDVFDVATGAEARVFQNVDFEDGLLAGIEFAPDGRHAFLVVALRSPLRDREHPTYAYPRAVAWELLDADLQPVRRITVAGGDNLSASASFDGNDRLLFTVPTGLDTRIVRYDIATQASQTLWDRPGSMFQAVPAANGVAFTYQNVDTPMEVWHLPEPAAGQVARPLTALNRAARFASGLAWADVRWTSEGRTLSGIYVYPETMDYPPAEPAPLVVWQQGGPGGQMTNDFGASVESPYSLLANFGIPVFVANAAGRSTDDPQLFADMAEGRNFGQLDIRQIKDGVDHLVREGVADADKVGITGCSYGGYFTLQSLRTYPDLYAAGNPQCTLADLTEEFTFGYTPFVSYLMGRAPMADPEEYLRDSPMYGAKDVKAPTLIFHGTKDFLPVPLINNIHDQIEANGVETLFFRARGYGHGLGTATDDEGDLVPGSGVSGQRYAFQLQLRFFREHVGAAAPPPENVPTTVFLPSIANRSPKVEAPAEP